jgi:hypothetical protein
MTEIDAMFVNLIKADTKIVQIISYESLRIEAMVLNAAEELHRTLYIWNRIDGIKRWDAGNFVNENVEGARDSSVALEFFVNKTKSILLLEDFYPDITENNPANISRIRNLALTRDSTKTLVLSQPFRSLPKELEKEVHILDIPYPGFNEIKVMYERVCRKYHITVPAEPDDALINAALGLTIMEAEKTFALAFIESGALGTEQIPLVIREKENVIKKSGFLEYYHPRETMDDIGGLANLIEWLKKRGRGFGKAAEEYGLRPPRGILLLGIPGTGKSLTAKAIGNLWHFPLLRMDIGKIFAGIVGESEQNIRGALEIAETIAPSILWIDEIEKGLAGMSSSGNTDGGTASRVMGTFLTWMQEKSRPVFVVATANDISKLPPELLRKGRVDELFFTDLPTAQEREHIIAIHLKKKKQNPQQFNLKELARLSKGFSGAELEEAVNEALYQAFYNGERPLKEEDLTAALAKTFPLSRTMREMISELRLWAKNRAVAASSAIPEPLDDNEEPDTPILIQERYNNPFRTQKE